MASGWASSARSSASSSGSCQGGLYEDGSFQVVRGSGFFGVGATGLGAAAAAARCGAGDGARKGGEEMPDGSAVRVKPGKLRMLPGLGMMGPPGPPDAIRPAQRKRTQHGAQPAHRNSQE